MDGYSRNSTSDNVSMTSPPADSGDASSTNTSHVATPMPFDVVIAVVYSMVFMVGFLGNTLAIYVVVRYAKMKTVTNMYILNLALADVIYILGIPFLGTNNVLSYWPYGDLFCKVCMTADAMSQFASTFFLTLMSIDRYLAVVHPIASVNWRKTGVVKVFSAAVWVVSFLVVLPVTIYSHVQEEFYTCNITWPDPFELWSIVFILYTSILGFFAPLLVICACYILIVIRMRTASVSAGKTKRRRSEHKVTRMVVIIVLVFVICWLPFFTTNIVNLIYIIPENNTTIYFILVILTYVNSSANPFLYAFLSENFRQSFQKVLCLHKPNGVSAATQMGSRQSNPKPNSNLVFTSRNHTQNGQMHSVQQSDILLSEPLTSKTEVKCQS
ncbi:somatostatin receptor type 5-like [Brachionichthys hirsutus]|uniref:somatostatin receptor type 5-like n=1 Tax=Brachionichthys hirsutus TaxID=412623 RepID=UPI00360491CA